MIKGTGTAPETLERLVRSLVATLDSLDFAAPDAATACLAERHPLDDADVAEIRELLAAGLRDGWLVLNDMRPGVQQGCVFERVGCYGVSALFIEGHGRGHTHPEGEVGLGFAWSGDPRIDGHGPGWVVFPPGSHHAPEVAGGRMLLLFFRPGGEVVWDAPGDATGDAAGGRD